MTTARHFYDATPANYVALIGASTNNPAKRPPLYVRADEMGYLVLGADGVERSIPGEHDLDSEYLAWWATHWPGRYGRGQLF